MLTHTVDAGTEPVDDTHIDTPDGLAREMTWRTGEPERVDVFFDHQLSPGGYSYLFILDGRATFGCAIVADFQRIRVAQLRRGYILVIA